MPEPQKPKRAYNSAKRQAQAHQTRRQILEAARESFEKNGYSGATLDAIAEKAGVAPETIFAVFGNKRSILAELVDLAVGGDNLPVPLLQRPGPQTVMREQEPRRQLHMFAYDIAHILARVAPLFEIMRMAAKTEPEIAELLQTRLANRLDNLGRFVQHVARHTALREGLGVEQATETVWAITSPELFRLLTVDRGWSQEQYSEWLGDALVRLLLPLYDPVGNRPSTER